MPNFNYPLMHSKLPEVSTGSVGQRRQLIIVLLILFGFVYLPRLVRLENYLLVTTKRSLSFSPAILPWKSQLEKLLSRFEGDVLLPFNRLQSISTSVTVKINQKLESLHCSPPITLRFARARALNPEFVVPVDFKRICQAPFSREAKRLLKLSGLTADGRVLLQTGDRVFIAGDSLMQGPATELSKRFRDRGIYAIDASRVSTGLAYPQFFDWVSKIKDAISKGRVDAVIVFLGANDTFDMYEGPNVFAVGTPAWQRLYLSRVEQIAAFSKQHNVPLIWLGMPAMNRSDIQPFIPMMNRLYKSAVQRHAGIYVPTDRTLGETENSYISSKVIKGKRFVLRADDGVHFTPIGWTLVADTVSQKISFR